MVPGVLVGPLTSCFWLRVGRDILRGQDLGEACGSANPLSQVGSGWVVGAHAVLGADGVAALHALHLWRQKHNSSLWKLSSSTTWAPAAPHARGFEGGHSRWMGSQVLTCWPSVFALVGSWCAHTAQLQVSWHGMWCYLAAPAPAHLWLVYLTAGEAGTQACVLHCKAPSGKAPPYGTDSITESFPDLFSCMHPASSRGEVSSSPYSSSETNPSQTGGNCPARWVAKDDSPTDWLTQDTLHDIWAVTHAHEYTTFLITQWDGKIFSWFA